MCAFAVNPERQPRWRALFCPGQQCSGDVVCCAPGYAERHVAACTVSDRCLETLSGRRARVLGVRGGAPRRGRPGGSRRDPRGRRTYRRRKIHAPSLRRGITPPRHRHGPVVRRGDHAIRGFERHGVRRRASPRASAPRHSRPEGSRGARCLRCASSRDTRAPGSRGHVTRADRRRLLRASAAYATTVATAPPAGHRAGLRRAAASPPARRSVRHGGCHCANRDMRRHPCARLGRCGRRRYIAARSPALGDRYATAEAGRWRGAR